MRVLLSAYACEPGAGSEQGVGWHWATELVRLGHEVVVITRANNRILIEGALTDVLIPGLNFQYYDLPSWGKWWKRGPQGVHIYYWIWQLGAYRLAKRLVSKMHFDLVHHLTFGGFRQPSLMGWLGLPFVIGPLGGGEVTPALLRGSFPRIKAVGELLREISNKLAYWSPLVRAMFRQATLILCKTRETLAILPPIHQKKGRVHLEIGLEPARIKQEVTAKVKGADFLYAGRLVYWKGLHLALKAFAELRRYQPEAALTVIGTGKDEARLKGLAVALGLQDSVQWLGRIPHEDIWGYYSRYTAFVFPSLHDSSGNVLLEALSQGLPVICLDTGGPGAVLPSTCGIKIRVENRSETDVVRDLTAAMKELADNPELCTQMSRRALELSRSSTWSDVVSSAYALVEDALSASAESGQDGLS